LCVLDEEKLVPFYNRYKKKHKKPNPPSSMSRSSHRQIALPDEQLLQDILRAEAEIKKLEAEIEQEEEAHTVTKVMLPEDPVTDTNLTALLQRLRPSTATKYLSPFFLFSFLLSSLSKVESLTTSVTFLLLLCFLSTLSLQRGPHAW